MKHDLVPLKSALEILKIGRMSLIEDFKAGNATIYRAMFEYEDQETLMTLEIDRFKTNWLDRHWSIYEEFISEEKPSQEFRETVENVFLRVYMELAKKFLDDSRTGSSGLFRKILKDKVKIIDVIIAAGERHDEMLNDLSYSREKNKRLFQRRMKMMKEDKNESLEDV